MVQSGRAVRGKREVGMRNVVSKLSAQGGKGGEHKGAMSCRLHGVCQCRVQAGTGASEARRRRHGKEVLLDGQVVKNAECQLLGRVHAMLCGERGGRKWA